MARWAHEFLRRFLFHVLPSGFQRIRHYGFLGNRYRRAKIEHCRQLIGDVPATPIEATDTGMPCPVCHRGRLTFIGLVRSLSVEAITCSPAIEDSS